MQTASLPRCPKCADGGNVKVVKTPNAETAIFKPLPDGWIEASESYECECGWCEPVAPPIIPLEA
jgi:hypothetical protein